MEVLVVALILDIIIGVVSYTWKGRNGFAFFFWAFLLSPLIGFIILLCVKNLKAEAEKERIRKEEKEADERCHLETLAALSGRRE